MFISLAFFFLQVLKVTSISLYFKLYSFISIYTILETSLVLSVFNLCMFFHVHLCGWACMFTSFLLCDVLRRQSLLLCLRCHLPFSIETKSLSRLILAKVGKSSRLLGSSCSCYPETGIIRLHHIAGTSYVNTGCHTRNVVFTKKIICWLDVVLMEMSPKAQKFEYTISNWWLCLGIIICDLAARRKSQ